MEELNAIRKDLSFGCEVSWYPTSHESTTPYIIRIDWTRYYENGALNQFEDEILYNAEIIWHPPVLSDVIKWLEINNQSDLYTSAYDDWMFTGYIEETMKMWNLSEPYLKDQSDELWKYLLSSLR
jgi:hypothetical protein